MIDPVDEIVFRSRNKEYGAYQLRKKYLGSILTGFITAVSISMVTVTYMLLGSYFNTENYTFNPAITAYLQLDIDEELMKLAQQDIEQQKPFVEEELPKKPEGEHEKTIVDNTDKTAETQTRNDSLHIANDTLNDTQNSDSSITDIWVHIDSLPRFNGSENGFRVYLVGKLKYPDTNVIRLLNARITICFIITHDGTVTNIKTDKSAENNPWVTELMRIVANAPRWKPAMAGGKPVSIMYTLPLFFL